MPSTVPLYLYTVPVIVLQQYIKPLLFGPKAPSLKMGSICSSYYLGVGVGVDFQSLSDWLARRQYVINVIWPRTAINIKDWNKLH